MEPIKNQEPTPEKDFNQEGDATPWLNMIGNIRLVPAAPVNTNPPKTLEQSIVAFKTGASTVDLYVYVRKLKKWVKTSFTIV